ncbi:hypothetical protein CLG96_06720 [Sphingomonas oleivorans]|uniref:CBS domain-containing protein n=1 Tax=Sphingomonas oleivorans TaxID=1735121 RepID=A0A2T5FZX6_9SPHN|nr:CBS domain-containing protein [Sphingomonas oleivorans]PTQ12235.1 hypothetical protein CLG96_06720 [Sphingomonas oleivorans]
MRISDVLRDKSHKLVTISPVATIRRAATVMKAENVGALLVQNPEGRLLGVLSERDILLGLASYGSDVLGLSVHELMTTDGPVAAPADAIVETMKVMTDRRMRHVPVVEAGAVIGLISIGDIMKYRLVEKTEENNVLQDLARFSLAAA